MIAEGCAFAALCILLGVMIGWPIGHWRGMRRAAEDAEDTATAAIIDRWKEPPDTPAATAADLPPVPPEVHHAGPGKHRHPAGPPQHELPSAGYLPAPASSWPPPWFGSITVPAPAQPPPWNPPEPEKVLEPTAVLSPPVTAAAMTDTAWTREMAAMVADMDRFIAEKITATDGVLKAITR